MSTRNNHSTSPNTPDSLNEPSVAKVTNGTNGAIDLDEASPELIVIGGGLAAMKSAVTAAKSGQDVLLLTKGAICSGASFYPMMDMVACQSSTGVPEEDEAYLQEILDCSMGMADEAMNRYYIENIRARVAEFPEIGVPDYKLTEPKVACFAHEARPTYVWSDWGAIRERMRQIVQEAPNLELVERCLVLALLVEDDTIQGVLVSHDGKLSTIPTKSVVLATGGMGDLYRYNLNSSDVSGDGQAMALQAGAELINIEFNQFIPGFVHPAYKTVFRETTIPYLASFQDASGNDILDRYLPDPEDRAQCLRERSTHGPFTQRFLSRYFDIAMMESIIAGREEHGVSGFPIRYRPEIQESESTFVRPYYQWLKEEHGVDLATDEVWIAPFWHAANGGVRIDHQCQTSIKGLFACGEVSGGIHGADRQGGQSTGSCLVFGYLAGQSAAQFASERGEWGIVSMPEDALQEIFSWPLAEGVEPLDAETIIESVRDILYFNGNVLRREDRLQEALAEVRQMAERFDPLPQMEAGHVEAAFKARNFLLLSQALLNAMLNRRESRGSHYREDYPEPDKNYEKRFVSTWEDGAISIREES